MQGALTCGQLVAQRQKLAPVLALQVLPKKKQKTALVS